MDSPCYAQIIFTVMTSFTIFYLSSFPAGICLIAYYFNIKKMHHIMRRENNKYTSSINGVFDLFRIVYVFFKSTTLSVNEKKILRNMLIYISVGLITILTWFFIWVFYPELYFGD